MTRTTAGDGRRRAGRDVGGRWWRPALGLLVAGLALGVAHAFHAQSLKLQALATEHAALAEQLRRAEVRRAQLLQEIERLQTPAYLEALARERLGYIRPGETPYMALGKGQQGR